MAFDFPNSPSVGQRVTGVGGIVYVWDGVKWASNIGSVTAQSMGDVGRNLLHNPLFNVAQRGAGPWTTVVYTADRWQLAINLDTENASIASLGDAARSQIGDEAAVYTLGNTFAGNAGATSFSALNQNIESVRRLAGKTVTVSFWAQGSAALKLGVSFIQSFGTGGSPSASVNVNGQSVTLTTSWARYSVTIAIPSASGKTFGTTAGTDYTALYLIYSGGSSNNTFSGNVGVQSGTINMWGVQLEIGSVATPLEKPDPRYDLANAQRFFCIGNINLRGYNTVGAGIMGMYSFPTHMRAIPTVAATVSAQNNTSGAVIGTQNADMFSWIANVAATADTFWNGTFTASADL